MNTHAIMCPLDVIMEFTETSCFLHVIGKEAIAIQFSFDGSYKTKSLVILFLMDQ